MILYRYPANDLGGACRLVIESEQFFQTSNQRLNMCVCVGLSMQAAANANYFTTTTYAMLSLVVFFLSTLELLPANTNYTHTHAPP